MARPKDADKRQLILAEAKRMFAEKGYDRSSMSALAARIGLPVGSLYTYFPSKEALLGVIIEEGWSEFAIYLEKGLGQASSSVEAGLAKLAFLIRKALPALFEDMDLIVILLGQAGSATRLKEKLDSLASLIASIIGECVAENGQSLRTAIPELEAGLLVMLLGSLESLRLSRRIDMGIGVGEIIAFLVSTVEATLGRALPEL
ncbi:MAG: TetR/AcrR family transcriptional regulator [Spirochaetia bacterium]|jgi:AcrR family transcriptional regulator|nr:TetR/AcrR family transcriptional regulator [Spirochaetia bacterium]